ncbi:MAG TPA: S-layer homology domain-containing protein, partial [Acidimicrobiales bacterium]|nr:S-layer homology domain-containing protein [Acidimicrobiales bacterium]
MSNPGFTDIGGDFFKVQIECMAAYGLTKGTTASTYSPQTTVSRGQMAEFFYRIGQMAGDPLDTSTPNPNYADADQIPPEFVPAVNALTNAKIVSGFPDNTYRPSAPVSRGEMSKFMFDFLTFVGAPIGNPGNGDYFYDDDGSNFENALNVDAAMGFYVGSPGSNGGQLSKLDQPTLRDQMAGFLSRVVEFGVSLGAFPNKFVPTSASVSPTSAPVGTNVLATISGANITNVAISGPCTSGITQSNTPAPNNGGQTMTLTLPISASASQGACALNAVITYTDNSTQTFPLTLLVTAPEAAAGTYTGLTVVSVDTLDATFQATNGTTTNSFTYGQPGTTYKYSETPGTNGSTTAQSISESQFALYLSGAAAPVVGDSINITYAGAGGANAFSITSDVPAAPTFVTATFTGAPATVTVTWNASTSPDVAAYQVQVDPTGSGTFTNVGSPVNGTQSGGVVTQSPATTLTDASQTAGATVVYRVVAMADANNGGASSAPSDPSAPVTLSGTPATALPGSGPTNPAITSITRPAAGSGGTTWNVSTTGADSNTCGPVASPC